MILLAKQQKNREGYENGSQCQSLGRKPREHQFEESLMVGAMLIAYGQGRWKLTRGSLVLQG